MISVGAILDSSPTIEPDGAASASARSRPRLSVVICCHNSRGRLEPTLKHLAAQTGLASDQWEIVLVDNGSADQTAACAQSLWQASGAPADLRVIAEPKLGLIHARIAGISAARHEILTFVDDDNWVCPTWCARVIDLMTAMPDLGVIGGHAEAAFEPGQTVPEWFAALRHGYAIGPQAARSGRIEAPLARFYGAGLTIRRDALKALFQGGFSPLCTGRTGARLGAGEDSELCYALAMNGWPFWYEDSLRFSHFMPAGRLSEKYARDLFHGLGFTSALEDYYFRMAPNRGSRDLVARIKRLGIVRYAGAVWNFLRHRFRALCSAPGGSARSQARIESSFFAGRLKGMLNCRRNSRAIVAHIAGWASKAPAANLRKKDLAEI